MGLGFLMQAVYLLPLTAVSLVLALAALGFRAGRRRGYGPLLVGAAAAAALLLGKFVLDANVAVYGGLAALVGASVWDAWPKSGPPAPPGARCQIGRVAEQGA